MFPTYVKKMVKRDKRSGCSNIYLEMGTRNESIKSDNLHVLPQTAIKKINKRRTNIFEGGCITNGGIYAMTTVF